MVTFRPARPEDGAALQAIYAPYVRETTITFELEPPDPAEFSGRISRCLTQFPWIVCEVDGVIAGSAYASELRERPAYQWNAELSLYLAPAFQRQGLGGALLTALLELLLLQGYRYAYACITASNQNSVRMHRRFGFDEVGRFPRAGYKLGEWHDVLWLAKSLPDGEAFEAVPSPPLPFPSLPEQAVAEILNRCAAHAEERMGAAGCRSTEGGRSLR